MSLLKILTTRFWSRYEGTPPCFTFKAPVARPHQVKLLLRKPRIRLTVVVLLHTWTMVHLRQPLFFVYCHRQNQQWDILRGEWCRYSSWQCCSDLCRSWRMVRPLAWSCTWRGQQLQNSIWVLLHLVFTDDKNIISHRKIAPSPVVSWSWLYSEFGGRSIRHL